MPNSLRRFTRRFSSRPGDASVTICIPAWQAGAFIDKTLTCARSQTHRNIRIQVSVDLSDDATSELCEAHARQDSRIKVFRQEERLGWAANVNFLLEIVDSDFFFLYFHDDLIDPTYTARLLRAIHKRPEAASVHCDMGHFGGGDHISYGRTYDGPPARRLLDFFLTPRKGSPLRSLTRSRVLETGLRLPTVAKGGFWANQPYLMKLLAAGPTLRVPRILYRRWHKRQGGLTDLWKRFSFEQAATGFQSNARICLKIVDGVQSDSKEHELMVFGLYIYLMRQVRQAELAFDVDQPMQAGDLHPRFHELAVPDQLSRLDTGTRNRALRDYQRLTRAVDRPITAANSC